MPDRLKSRQLDSVSRSIFRSHRANFQPDAKTGIEVEEDNASAMNLCRLLDQIQTEACSWRVRIDAVKRLEYLLALRDGDARPFIAKRQ